ARGQDPAEARPEGPHPGRHLRLRNRPRLPIPVICFRSHRRALHIVADVASAVSAILLDAGGVLVFPEPANLLPHLREAGVDPDLLTPERAPYRALAPQDPPPPPP